MERRIVDRRTKLLEECPLCHSDNVIDKGYCIECLSCGLFITESDKTKKFGGYKVLWRERTGKIVPDDFL